MKRGTDHSWEIRKYSYDTAYYAHCKCGYEYDCSKIKIDNNVWQTEIRWLAHYCPNCGARKKWYNEEPIKIAKYSWS